MVYLIKPSLGPCIYVALRNKLFYWWNLQLRILFKMEEETIQFQKAPEKPKSKIDAWTVLYFIYSLYILLLLGIASLLRVSQRNFITVVAVPLQRDLKLSDQIFGAINGPVFSFFSAVSGLVAGRMTDLYSRKINLIFLMVISGIATSLHGLCVKPWHLVVCRAGLAIGLSGLSPISMSLIPDYFSDKYRATVIGVYNLSQFLGGGVTFVFGAFVVESTSNWKLIYMALGIPSIILAFVMACTMAEPEKGALDQKKEKKLVSTWTALKYLLSTGTVWCLNICAGFCYMATNASQVWSPTFYKRVHGLEARDLSKYLSWLAPIGALLGTIIGGISADRLTKYNKRFYSVIPTVAIAVAIPIQIAIFVIPWGVPSVLLTFPMAIVALSAIPSMYLLTINVVPLAIRSLATSWFMLFLGGIGSLSPLIVGFLNDANFPFFNFKPQNDTIRWSLLTLNTASFAFACIAAALMFFFIPRDFARLEKWIEENKEPEISNIQEQKKEEYQQI